MNSSMERNAKTIIAERMAKMQAVNAKRNADLKALLSADADKAKFDENAVAVEDEHGRSPCDRCPGDRAIVPTLIRVARLWTRSSAMEGRS